MFNEDWRWFRFCDNSTYKGSYGKSFTLGLVITLIDVDFSELLIADNVFCHNTEAMGEKSAFDV